MKPIALSAKHERIHSLDSLRAVMMILGIVLHSTEVYLEGENPPFPKDSNSTHIALNYLEYLIHMFRMPVFFLLAGFFAAMLYYVKGREFMIRNRLRRIALPFMVFLIVLYPVVTIALQWGEQVITGNGNQIAIESKFFIPSFTLHLWFLYYLLLCTAITLLLSLVLRRLKRVKLILLRRFRSAVENPVARISYGSLLVLLLLLVIWDLAPPVPLSFFPDLASLLFYQFFYLIGWLLFLNKSALSSFELYDRFLIFLGITIFTVEFIFYNEIDDFIKGMMSATVIVALLSGIIGVFMRYFKSRSRFMRYVSDSSYWVYLIHLPFTIIIPVLLIHWDISGIIKFSFTVILTSIICFSSYDFFVRRTLIGKFLNGKKYTIQKNTQ